jgi:short-subunit dehydrogenase
MKVIVITGASSGIGYAMAQFLCKKGHKVYGISRTKIHEKSILSIQADVTNYDQIKAAYEEIYEQEGSIDVIINNAGVGISGSIEDSTTEDVKDLFDVNFIGVFHSTKAAIPLLRKSGGGKIFNISSVAGKFAIPFQSFYSASKAAVNSFSEALQIEVHPFDIQVCSVMPGDIKTGFTKNRKKNDVENPYYQQRIQKSVAVMENDELNGMEPELAAKVLNRLIQKKKIPLYVTIGFKYKLMVCLERLLPKRLVNRLISSIYGFTKEK